MYPDESPKRFDRIVSILIQLQSKKIVKAKELADRFEVSLRTIYRDIRTLEASGVPIYSEAGVGYSLVDGYRLPPVMFSREEAGSFVAAEKLMQKFTDENMKKHFQSAVFKVKSVLRGSEKDWVESIESKIKISGREEAFRSKSPEVLEILFESIAQKFQIEMIYQSVESESPSERLIEPVGLYHESNFWYILAYCHLRKDYRNFRTDRVLEIHRTEIPFENEHRELEYYLKPKEPNGKEIVKFRIDRKAARYIQNDRKYYGYVSETFIGDKVEMVFEANYRENGMGRWFLMFADLAEIVEPEGFKELVKELVCKVQEKIN